MGLYAAYQQRENDAIYVFYYDGHNRDKMSGILDLNTVQFIDLDDKELDETDLALFNYAQLRIWTPPSSFRKFKYEMKLWFQKIFKKR